jgi:hypothetical protein
MTSDLRTPIELRPLRPNECRVCGIEHKPEAPHVLDSLYYETEFYHEHGRQVTMQDAVAHCSDSVKAKYLKGE